jgi:hypothetical protein
MLLLIFVFIVITYSGRVGNYANGFINLYSNLSNGLDVGGNIRSSLSNIYPVWHRLQEVMNFNFLPSFIGTGLGTSSVVNNLYFMQSNMVTNPNANIIRMFFDVGIFGLLILTKVFIYPISRFNIDKVLSLKLLFIMIFILGAYYGHRSVAPFLFLGLMIMVIENKFPVSLNKD